MEGRREERASLSRKRKREKEKGKMRKIGSTTLIYPLSTRPGSSPNPISNPGPRAPLSFFLPFYFLHPP